jgi:hypothetical protein
VSKVHILFYSVAEREVRGASVAAFLPRGAPCVNLILQSVAERGVRGGASVAAFLPRGAPYANLIFQSVAEREVRGGASVAAFPPRGAPCVTAWCAVCWPGARAAATAVTSITCAPGAAATDAPTARPAAAISASTAEIRILPLRGGRVGGRPRAITGIVGKFAQFFLCIVALNQCCGSALFSMRIRIQLFISNADADPDAGSQNADPDPC